MTVAAILTQAIARLEHYEACRYLPHADVVETLALLRQAPNPGDPVGVQLSLTPSQLMALKDLLLDYVLAKRTEVFVDVVGQVETTPADLLALVTRLE